jgi:hypothetical protein
MNIRFLEPAAAELYEAIVYYNIQRNGLGLEFAKEVQDTIERIKQNPEASPRQANFGSTFDLSGLCFQYVQDVL